MSVAHESVCVPPKKMVRKSNMIVQDTGAEEKAVKVDFPNYSRILRRKKIDKTSSYNDYIQYSIFGHKKTRLSKGQILLDKANENLITEGVKIIKMNENKNFDHHLFQQIVGLFESIQTSNGEKLFQLAEQIEEIKSGIYKQEENDMRYDRENIETNNNRSVLDDSTMEPFSFKKIGRKLLSTEEFSNDNKKFEEENGNINSDYEEGIIDDDSRTVNAIKANDNSQHKDDNYDDEEDMDEEETDEYETTDDFDLLDEESLTSLLDDYDEISEKLIVLQDLIVTLETKIENKDDEELRTSAIQSLIVYLYAMQDMEPSVKNSSFQVRQNFKNLNARLKILKGTHLRLVTHLESFVAKSWDLFEKLLDDSVIQTFKRNDVINLINDFVFNFHYATETMKIIKSRGIPDEIDMIDGASEDMKVMEKFYQSLGVEPEVQDESYFTKALKGFVSDGEEEELDAGFQSRNLLSVKDEEMYGHCSKDDPECSDQEKSIFSDVKPKSISTTLPPKLSTVESSESFSVTTKSPLSGMDRCKDFLARTEQFSTSPEVMEERIGKMTPSEKIKSIKHFLTKMKISQKMLEEYKSIQESITDPQQYLECHKMLKEALATIQSQASNNKWMGHLSSLMASNDQNILNELNDILTPKEDDDTKFKSRKLLSIDEDEDDHCDEDNGDDCGLKHESLLLQGQSENKDDSTTSLNRRKNLATELKKDLDEAFEMSKHPGKKEDPKKSRSAIERCQSLLVNSRKYLKSLVKDSKLKEVQKMNPKQKVKALKVFMKEMTKSKKLLEEYQQITTEMKDHSDVQVCQPLLKESLENLSELQAGTDSGAWMGHMSSLLESNDPDVMSELNDIITSNFK